MRFSLSRYIKYHYYKMLRVKDTPSKVAQGVSIGFAMDFAIPIPFLSIFIAFIIARIIKVNSLAAVMSATALKPFFPAIIASNYYVQSILVKIDPDLKNVVLPHAAGTNFLEVMINKILNLGVPYLMAGFINGAIVFVISYFLVNYALKLRIRKIKEKRFKRPR